MNILSGLKELFDPDNTENASDENPNFIVRPNRIKHMLQVLVDAHVQVVIVMEDGTKHTSRILDISRKGILLDQLSSRASHNQMVNTIEIRIDAKYQAVPFNFNSTIIDNKTSKHGGYLISYPEKIYHPQKRDFFRIQLKQAEKYKFIGAVQYSENTITGYIYDISFGGICIAVNSSTYVKKGAILAPASLSLNGSERIGCDFTVCSVKKSPVEGFARIGCQFLNINSATKKLIHQFISTQERLRAKKSVEPE